MSISINILPNDQIDPKTWDEFVLQSPQGSLYALYGYASAVAPDWQGLVISEKGAWVAIMPTLARKKWGFPYLTHPVFAQYWGILFLDTKAMSVYKQYSLKRKIGLAVTEALADKKLVTQYFAPEFDYPLPFVWKGYSLTSRYTFQLSLQAEVAVLKKGFASALLRQIKKAEKSGLQVVTRENPSDLFEIIRQNRDAGHDLTGTGRDLSPILSTVSGFLQSTGRGSLLSVMDPEKNVLAAGLFARYKKKTIYLIGGYQPEKGNTGAMPFLMYHALLNAKEKGSEVFDFEGSMIEGIETFFRKFGAHPVSYLQIGKNKLPLLLRWIQELR